MINIQENGAAMKAQTNTSYRQWPMGRFKYGDKVRKIKGSEWTGTVVGWYSTKLTHTGYAVESDTHQGAVQIYPDSALEFNHV